MENNRLDPTSLEEEDLNWEKRLERLRQARQFNTTPTHAPLVKKSDEAVDAASKTAPKKEYKLDADNREKVLEEYLYRWQLNTIQPLLTRAKQWKPMRWWFCRTTG